MMTRNNYFVRDLTPRVVSYLYASAVVTSLLFLFQTNVTYSHDGIIHESTEEANNHLLESLNTEGFPDIKGGDYSLINQFGNTRTSVDPNGQHQFIFFGYANCKAICSVALPRMSAAVDELKNQDIHVTPVLITVDPERDTIKNLRVAAKKIHPDLIGLTGSDRALNQAYDAFNIEKSFIFNHPDEGAIYSHGSYIYLLGPNGDFITLFPPIIGFERIAEVTANYITGVVSN